MKISERLTGPCLVVFGAGVIAAATQLPQVPGVRFGADLMPEITGVALIILGATIGWAGWTKPSQDRMVDVSEWDVAWRKKAAALWSVGALIASTFLFQSVGFPILGLAFMATLMALMGARPLTVAVVAPVFVLALFLGFTKIMHVELPAGPLGGLL